MDTSIPEPNLNLPKHTHKVLWVVLGVLLLAVIIGSYFWWQDIKVSEQLAENSNQETQNPTADWQTYRNEEYGFEMKFPLDKWNNLKVDKKLGKVSVIYDFSLLLPENYSYSKDDYASPFAVMVVDKDYWDELSDEERYREIGGAEFQRNAKYVFAWSAWQDPLPGYGSSELGIDQILSTFKFVDAVTADWKTYRNDEYGFELNYPSNLSLEIKPSQDGNVTYVFFKLLNDSSAFLIIEKNPENKSFESVIGEVNADISETVVGDNIKSHKVVAIRDPNVVSSYIMLEGAVLSINRIYPEDEPIFNQILSTIKFIEPTSKVSETPATPPASDKISPEPAPKVNPPPPAPLPPPPPPVQQGNHFSGNTYINTEFGFSIESLGNLVLNETTTPNPQASLATHNPKAKRISFNSSESGMSILPYGEFHSGNPAVTPQQYETTLGSIGATAYLWASGSALTILRYQLNDVPSGWVSCKNATVINRVNCSRIEIWAWTQEDLDLMINAAKTFKFTN